LQGANRSQKLGKEKTKQQNKECVNAIAKEEGRRKGAESCGKKRETWKKAQLKSGVSEESDSRFHDRSGTKKLGRVGRKFLGSKGGKRVRAEIFLKKGAEDI